MPRPRRDRRGGAGPKPAASRARRGPVARDPAARASAKDLLRASGVALERGDRDEAALRLEEALRADSSFVEPALALAALHASQGDRAAALRAVEEGVTRGRAIVDRIPPKPGTTGPSWWRDEATRPYMKALVARGLRLLEAGEHRKAALQFDEVYLLEPDEDPLEAGVFGAEARLRDGDAMGALAVYAELEEQPSVALGRALALFRTGQPREALVSLWLALLINPAIAESLTGPLAIAGLDRSQLAADADEAAEIASRTGDLWSEAERRAVDLVLSAPLFREDLLRFGELARRLDAAAGETEAAVAMAGIESLLAAERVERAVEPLLGALAAAEPPRRRLPLA